jgi:hypothetical protein
MFDDEKILLKTGKNPTVLLGELSAVPIMSLALR